MSGVLLCFLDEDTVHLSFSDAEAVLWQVPTAAGLTDTSLSFNTEASQLGNSSVFPMCRTFFFFFFIHLRSKIT